MPIVKDVKIVKVPLTDKERPPDIPMSFPKMPRLYLELFENKAKIKQDLINKEYVPPKGSEEQAPVQEKPKLDENVEIKEENSGSSPSAKSVSVSDNETKSVSESESDSDSASVSNSNSDTGESGTKKSSDTDDLSVRLKELLGDDKESSDKSPSSSINISDKYSRPPKSIESKGGKYTPYTKHTQPVPHDTVPRADPPTLAELEQKGQFQRKPEIRDINNIPTSEYEEEDKKRELIFKFDLLRKSYPLAATTIPEYSIHTDFREMTKSYESTVKRLSLDSTVESYKTYLIYGFVFIEWVFGKFLGFDMQGFTQQQITSMNSYERLLIELGEKSYVPSGSRWPVELRLLFLVIINAGFFIIGKMVMRSTGANLMSMLNSVTTPVQPPKPKRRMKGPNVDPNDIPDATDEPIVSPQTATTA